MYDNIDTLLEGVIDDIKKKIKDRKDKKALLSGKNPWENKGVNYKKEYNNIVNKINKLTEKDIIESFKYINDNISKLNSIIGKVNIDMIIFYLAFDEVPRVKYPSKLDSHYKLIIRGIKSIDISKANEKVKEEINFIKTINKKNIIDFDEKLNAKFIKTVEILEGYLELTDEE